MLKSNRRIDPNQVLFLQEEFKADSLINNIRFFIIIILGFMALVKSDFERGIISSSIKITGLVLAIALFYTVILFFAYRKNKYHPVIKFISVTIDMTLIIFSIFAYKFDPYSEYATIYFLARFSIIFIFIILSILRYNFWLSFYAGLIAAIEYVWLVIFQNQMNGIEFTFLGQDGNIHSSEFLFSEIYLRVFYIMIAGFVAGITAIKLRSIVSNSLAQEQEKNKLEIHNRIVETVNAENKKYLDNITDGLLLIDKDYLINNQYSKILSRIFETDEIGGTPFINLIYPDKQEQAEERKELSDFLALLFSHSNAEFSMIMDVNPIINKTITVHGPDGSVKTKIITTAFHRIINKGLIENVMVIIKDVTELLQAQQKLEEEKSRHETDIEIISVILGTRQGILDDFLGEADKILNKVESSIGGLENKQVMNATFRNLHSLKGSARSLGFIAISRTAHTIEDKLSKFRDSETVMTTHEKSEIRALIDQIFSNFAKIKELCLKFKAVSIADQKTEPNRKDEQEKLEGFLDSIRKMTGEIAADLDKNILLDIKKNVDTLPFLGEIKNPIIHMVRNAIDHGIEDKFERLSSMKDEQAKITLSILKTDSDYHLSVHDDGLGIDFDLIRKLAIEKNLLNNDDKITRSKLLGVLFLPAFSSRDKITDISGRGVGLDVVKDVVNKLKGKIAVHTDKGKGTKISMVIPVN